MNKLVPQQQIISDMRLNAGLMREILFQSKFITLTDPNNQNEQISVIDIQEANTRDRDIERKIYVRFSVKMPRNIDQKQNFQFKCSFSNFTVSWNAVLLLDSSNNEYYFVCPKEIEKFNQRSSNRIKDIPFVNTSYPVQVRTHGLYTQAILEIEDISKNGVGGKLTFYGEFPISTETQIRATIDHGAHTYNINGLIRNWSILTTETTYKNQPTYRIGILNLKNETTKETVENNIQSSESFVERRKQKRYNVDGDLTVYSALSEDHPLLMELKDISVSGFKAKLKNTRDSGYLPAGISVRIDDQKLYAELLEDDGESMRFQIIRGSEEARLKWLKRLESLTNKNISHDISNSEDLISLFCESGAMSSTYLKLQRGFAKEMMNDFSNTKDAEPWVHKWIEWTETGEIRGHLSFVRYGDNCWSLENIAGSSKNENKMSKDLLSDFVHNFKSFLESASTYPKILLGIKTGHPFWDSFIEKIKFSDGFLDLSFNYFRFNSQTNDIFPFKIKQIKSQNYFELYNIHENLKTELSNFVNYFDFNRFSFSSPRMKDFSDVLGKIYNKVYFKVTTTSGEYLFLVNETNINLSQNSNDKIIWIFPLNDSEELNYEEIFYIRKKLTNQKVVGALQVSSNKSRQDMRWIMFEPKYLSELK